MKIPYISALVILMAALTTAGESELPVFTDVTRLVAAPGAFCFAAFFFLHPASPTRVRSSTRRTVWVARMFSLAVGIRISVQNQRRSGKCLMYTLAARANLRGDVIATGAKQETKSPSHTEIWAIAPSWGRVWI